MSIFNDLSLIERESVPDLPMVGSVKVYYRNGQVYKLYPDGSEIELGAGVPLEAGLASFGWDGRHYGNGMLNLGVTLFDPTEYTSISTGINHVLAVKNDGTLWSWGNPGNGKLGNGSLTLAHLIATQVGTDTNWLKVSAGNAHSGAIKTDGTLWMWGLEVSYRLGNNSNAGNITTPTQIGTDTDWQDISCGNANSFAIKNSNLMVCGQNTSNATGLNNTVGNTLVWTLADSGGWTSVFAGVDFGLGIKNDQIWGWGNNLNGRNGMGTVSGSTAVPTQCAETSTGWSKISVGNVHSIFLKTNGTIWYTGSYANGRCGNNIISSGNTSTPTQWGSDTDWEDIAACGLSSLGDQVASSYAIKAGKLMVTGLNNYGQLGLSPISVTETGTWTQLGSSEKHEKVFAGGGFGLTVISI
jgi:alpha-tubulin suppressor-like RCC1 family protein